MTGDEKFSCGLCPKAVTVNIPSIGREDRIGMALNHVFQIMYQTEQTDVKSGVKIYWDFSECRFLHPFFLAPLAVIKNRYADSVECINVTQEIKGYLDRVFFNLPLSIFENENENDETLWNRYTDKSYIPVCLFNPRNKSSVTAQTLVQNAIRRQFRHNSQLYYILSHLLSELTDNITDHSKSDKGYIYCQSLQKGEFLHVFICDTGRSIYSTYAADERYADDLTLFESSALQRVDCLIDFQD